MTSSTFSLRSLGCARSLVDSETMIQDLNKVGFQVVPEGSRERIMVLNTCSFIQSAIDETEANIRELITKKRTGSLDYVVVTGCYPSRFKPKEREEKFPDVDLWFTTQEEHELKTKLSELVFQKKFQPVKEKPYTKLTPRHYAYLKISEGCDNWCSFCTIPKIRGKHTSKTVETILKEAELHIALGAQELILIAEDTTCWGEDIYGKPSLPLLLRELAKLPVRWIRPMYIFPSRVDDELISVIKNSPTITNYIDMPIQHASTPMLSAMKRRHDEDFLTRLLDDMFAEIPDLALRTTLMTGFPGETDADVHALCAFLERFPIAQLGCFTYSKERETRSARFGDTVPLDIAKQRLDLVMKTQYSCLQQRLPTLVGQQFDVVYEGNQRCRSYRESPDVDSLIILDTPPTSLQPGETTRVSITGHSGYDLLADI